MTNDGEKRILELLGNIRQDGVERAERIESIHDAGKDTRERVIRVEAKLEAQDNPKRLDAHSARLSLLERRIGRLESFFVIIGAAAGALATLVVNWISSKFGKG